MIKLGLIGTGRIANRFVDAVELVDGVKIAAVYNPNKGSAAGFVAEKNLEATAFEDFDSFIEVVDAVYIASPHETHYQYILDCLKQDKHVLCEKPMTLKATQTEMVYKEARRRGLVLREAIKSAYCEGFLQMMEIARSGKIGQICDVEACFTRLTANNVREYMDIENGGSLTELGSYVLLPIIKLFGTEYESVNFQSILAPNGVDSYTKVYLTYANGMALAKAGLGVKSEGQLLISGTKGYILCPSPWWLTKYFQVRYEDPNIVEEYNCEYIGNGLQYELAAFVAEILDIVAEENDNNRVLDSWLEEIGVDESESMAIAGILENYLDEYKTLRKRPTEAEKSAVNIWAHRGCSYEYPENTLMAFEAAAKLPGIKGIELDVQLTADGEVVVFHDENVKRVTDGDKNVVEYTLAQLKELTVAPGTEKATRIPTLAEVLECLKPYCLEKGLMINIELKTGVNRYQGIEEKTHELVKRYGLQQYIIYSSFLPESIQHIKEIDPEVRTGMLAGPLDDCVSKGLKVNADDLHPSVNGLSRAWGDEWKNSSIRAWNSDEPFYYNDKRKKTNIDLREMCLYGVTDIFTNMPERYTKIKLLH